VIDGSGLFAVLRSRPVWAGHIAKVRVDTLSMPGGRTADREVVEHDRAVAVVALDTSGNVVMLEQFRHPLRRRLWELPAGLMDQDGESARSAAERELAEETGLSARHWSILVDIASSPGFTDEAVRVFLATDLTEIGRQGEITDEEADLKVVRVPLVDAIRGVFDGRIVNGSAVAGLLAASVALGVPVSTPEPRSADDPWTSGPSTLHIGPGVPDAPTLGA
jgi:8-oxo-dGTP pyrophosphatase MutT (NUDIX family)